MAPDPAEGFALVTYRDLQLRLAPGESVTLGRAEDCGVRLGHDPLDRNISRHAGIVECRNDGALIHNTSRKRGLVMQPIPGPGYEIGPGMIAGTSPHEMVRLVFTGHDRAVYRVHVDVRGLCAARPAPVAGLETTGYERLSDLSGKERLYLCALCLWLMTRTGRQARVPTYAEMEQLLATYGWTVKARTIRNTLDGLRLRLWAVHGVEGLRDDAEPDGGPVDPPGRDYRAALADWAIRSGTVGLDDLECLEHSDHPPSR